MCIRDRRQIPANRAIMQRRRVRRIKQPVLRRRRVNLRRHRPCLHVRHPRQRIHPDFFPLRQIQHPPAPHRARRALSLIHILDSNLAKTNEEAAYVKATFTDFPSYPYPRCFASRNRIILLPLDNPVRSRHFRHCPPLCHNRPASLPHQKTQIPLLASPSGVTLNSPPFLHGIL